MFVQVTDLVFLLCLQAFKEMLYAAQDQAPSIEGITCMHTQSCTYGLTGNYIDFLFLSPSLALLIRAVAVLLCTGNCCVIITFIFVPQLNMVQTQQFLNTDVQKVFKDMIMKTWPTAQCVC